MGSGSYYLQMHLVLSTRARVMGYGLGVYLWQQFILTEMAILDFHGFAMTLKCKERQEVYVVLKLVKIPYAKHPLFGINQKTKLETAGVNCMGVCLLAPELMLEGMQSDSATKDVD